MFSDEYKSKKIAEADLIGIGTFDEEVHKPEYIGQVTDLLTFHEDGVYEISPELTVEAKAGDTLELEGFNTVVNNMGVLIASLMKRQANYQGALYWEVGSGLSSWSDSSPPAPTTSDTSLVTPLYRKAIQLTDMSFIDANNNVVTGPTNRIQIVVTFNSDEANGYLREFGLFGGDGSCTSALGSGLMMNRKTHGSIYKTSGITLQRTMRFTF